MLSGPDPTEPATSVFRPARVTDRAPTEIVGWAGRSSPTETSNLAYHFLRTRRYA